MQNYIQQPPYMRQFQQPFYSNQTGYKVMPISNEAEINNYTVDFNGTPTYFHNQTTNEILLKQFDL